MVGGRRSEKPGAGLPGSEDENTMAVKTIDARGMLCPRPLILVKKALEEMAVGEPLEVLLDNATACDNVRRFLQDHGSRPEEAQAGGVFTLRAVKAAAAVPERPAAAWCPSAVGSAAGPAAGSAVGPTAGLAGGPAGARPPVVVINREGMGTGSEELGRLLLQACCSTLKELQPLPSAIVFYNAGIKLACEGSPVLPALRDLEARGVKLLVCGTCLDFFALKAKRQVGTVSNMYDILQTLAGAGAVINP
jgi:selenium metabolism protein YedF